MPNDRLIAFVDLKDPFMPGPIAGEDRPGPVLSVAEARNFSSAILFHTPHTRQNAEATVAVLADRHPRCEVSLRQLAVSDPKDYSALMGTVALEIGQLQRAWFPALNYLCVSSGTAEMRAVWFLLTASGLLEAKLLHVGSPAEPLFGAANVREIELQSAEWASLRDLLMPLDYFAAEPSGKRTGTLFALNLDRRTASKSSVAASPAIDGELEEALKEIGIVITSAVMQAAAERVHIAAGTDQSILILGETGTGKDMFARLVHRLSARRDGPMIGVNCAAIPESLIDSHLFGHLKGSFTGAVNTQKGKFELANGGTLFLDEVGELSLDAQARLLTAIDKKEVDPIGSTKTSKVDIRIIAATNRDLAGEVAEKRFRADLYFRLNQIPIRLSPLRERVAEIPHLAVAIMNRINSVRSKRSQLSKQALRRLEEHSWPGNVRELDSTLQRSVALSSADILLPEHILIDPLPSASDPLTSLPEPAPGFSLKRYVTQVKHQLILKALARTQNNQAAAAGLLGMSKQAINQFLKKEEVNLH